MATLLLPPDVSTLQTSISGLVQLAEQDLDKLGHLPETAVVEALYDLLPQVVDQYTLAAGAVAADWYDNLRNRGDQPTTFRAVTADIRDHGVQALIGWSAAVSTDDTTFWSNLKGGIQRRIANGARQSVMQSAIADPAAHGWHRVGVGENCDFCNMLIGRGDVYTVATVKFRSHDRCNCLAAPAFEETTHIRAAAGTRPAIPERPTAQSSAADRLAYRLARLPELILHGFVSNGEPLAPGEIDFAERMVFGGEQIEWIKSGSRKLTSTERVLTEGKTPPDNDFIWLSNGGILVEHKGLEPTTPVTYKAIARQIAKATEKNAKIHTVDNVIVDVGDRDVSREILDGLRDYNLIAERPIKRLWVMSHGRLIRIQL